MNLISENCCSVRKNKMIIGFLFLLFSSFHFSWIWNFRFRLFMLCVCMYVCVWVFCYFYLLCMCVSVSVCVHMAMASIRIWCKFMMEKRIHYFHTREVIQNMRARTAPMMKLFIGSLARQIRMLRRSVSRVGGELLIHK